MCQNLARSAPSDRVFFVWLQWLARRRLNFPDIMRFSLVTWNINSVRLRMEQVGFRTDQEPYYRGATVGWKRNFTALEQLLSRID